MYVCVCIYHMFFYFHLGTFMAGRVWLMRLYIYILYIYANLQ